MFNKFNNELKKEENTRYTDIKRLNNGNGGDGNSSGGYSFEHPSYDDIMKFVTANKAEILQNSINAVKMIKHFCECEDCRIVKNEMMQMEDEMDFAFITIKK